ncbi:MAG TPA: ATP-binding SpoIIE family protein phosphatase [Candidatus Binatia bacterium]|nr:ATP-binding SpoIIE family protein phosphatase [Candidatus Binatia bacterium]
MNTKAVSVAHRTHIAEARRLASDLAREIGFDTGDVGRVAIVVTEAATNLVKHAGGGEILLQSATHEGGRGLEVVALDRGPGIANVDEALRDGFSTGGSAGTGLGAISRQSSVFDIHSAPGVGTGVLARLWLGPDGKDVGEAIGGISVSKPGEDVCGDAWAVVREADRVRVFLADGLGHGPLAAQSASRAREVFLARPRLDPADVIGLMHDALRPTRGAAVAVADVDRGREVVRFAGVGNVAASILSGAGSRSMVSTHGTLGHDLRKVRQFEYPWPSGALLVMYSDGLASRWSLERYRGLESRDPTLIAAVLYRDFQRGRDDATVVVVRDAR